METLKLNEQDIKDLLKPKTETNNFDYKVEFRWDKENKDGKLGIVKDILAMANTQDGGKLVFGVKDSDYDFVGLSKEDFESFDQTDVNNFLQNYTEPKFACQVYKTVLYEKYVVVIDVPEFKIEPIICKKDAHSNDDSSVQILKAGQIYIRTDKATTEAIKSVEDMRDLLTRATVKKGDELLHNIQLLITGKPLKTDDDTIEKYEKEIEEAKSFFNEKIGSEYSKYGYWQVVSYPNTYLPKRISDKKEIRKSLESSQVSLRGWNFPRIGGENTSNFEKGRESYTLWEYHVEGYRAFKSGLFIWKGYFWNDIENGRLTEISFIYAIYSITEYLLFIRRYYEELGLNDDDDLVIEISLFGTKNRALVSEGHIIISEGYFSKEISIENIKNVRLIDLKTSYTEIAKDFIKATFLEFNFKISDKSVNDWQKKLLK